MHAYTMDVDMADARATRSRAPRRASASRRAAPYQRDNRAANLSIKGASGPTWIVAANLVRGTSPQDVRVSTTLTSSRSRRLEK